MTVTRIAASKAQAWAVGVECANGFQPRRIVWGRILARAEKRKGEVIVPVVLATPEERDADIVEAVQAYAELSRYKCERDTRHDGQTDNGIKDHRAVSGCP